MDWLALSRQNPRNILIYKNFYFERQAFSTTAPGYRQAAAAGSGAAGGGPGL
jgi:hypothetical protein